MKKNYTTALSWARSVKIVGWTHPFI